MPDQLIFYIAGCPKRSDDTSFFCNRITGRDAKYKSHDHDDDIEKHDHHCLVTSHIISSKYNRLILILRYKIFQSDNFSHCLHQIFRNILFLKFCLRFFIVGPCIIILQLILIQRIKFFIRHYAYSKLYSIKHRIVIILKQTAVI